MKYLPHALVLILAALFAGCSPSASDSFGDSDIEAIKQTMQEYRDAWMQGDSAAVLGNVCEDIILHMPNETGEPVVGMDSVAAFWFPPSDVSYPITGYDVTHVAVEGSGDLALYSGLSRLTWHTQRGDVHSDTTTSFSEFLNVLRREEGQWKLCRIIYNMKEESYNPPVPGR